MFKALARALLRHRAATIAAMALLTLGALATLPFLRFNFSPQAIFDGEGELQAFQEELSALFPSEENLLLLVLRAPEGADIASPEALIWQRDASVALRAQPAVIGVESVSTLGIPRQHPDDPTFIDTSPLVKDGALSPQQAQQAREVLRGAVLLHRQVVSADLKTAAVVVRLDPEIIEIAQVTQAIEGVEGWIGQHPPPDGYELFLHGVPQLRRVIVGSLRREQLTLLPMTALVFLVVLALLFRSPAGVFPPLIAVGVAVAWTVGAMVLMGQHINIINNILAILLFVIGISDSVHIVTRYAEECQRSPGDWGAALIRTIEHLGLACFLTSATTAVGFGSLVVARTELLRSFGWQAAMGAMITYGVTILFLGASLTLLRPPTRAALNEARGGWIERVVDRMAGWVLRWPRSVVAGCVALMAVALWAGLGVKVDSFLLESFDRDHVEAQRARLIERELGGFLPVEISLKAASPKAFLEPEVFAAVARVERFAVSQPEVLTARSYVDLHQEMRVALLGDAAQREALPTLDARGRQQLFQIQELLGSGGESLRLGDFLRGDAQHARVRLRVSDAGSRAVLAMVRRLEAELAEVFPPGGAIEARVAGGAYVASSGLDHFIRDLFASLVAAVVVIFLMMGLLFRSARVGLISVLPNAAPLVLLLGYLWLRGYDLNTTNVILFSISLGLAVNDTIHFLTRFREEIVIDHDVHAAIRRSFQGAGRAIVLTTVLLVVGLSVVFVSDFLPSRRFAELTIATLGAALVGDLLVLPACLALWWRSPLRASRGGEG